MLFSGKWLYCKVQTVLWNLTERHASSPGSLVWLWLWLLTALPNLVIPLSPVRRPPSLPCRAPYFPSLVPFPRPGPEPSLNPLCLLPVIRTTNHSKEPHSETVHYTLHHTSTTTLHNFVPPHPASSHLISSDPTDNRRNPQPPPTNYPHPTHPTTSTGYK